MFIRASQAAEERKILIEIFCWIFWGHKSGSWMGGNRVG
jgi:hypothetical protein